MQINKTDKPVPRTARDFRRRGLGKPFRKFDTSDLQQLQVQKVDAPVVRSDTNHLLMASLLEQLCHMYVTDRSVAQQLFKKLCEQLSKLNIIAPLSVLDELSGLRFQHRSMVHKIMGAAISSLKQPTRALTASEHTAFMDRLAPSDDDIDLQTSRYRNEFRELELLGKGGFGKVYKAQHFLDGRQYAVKKIRFKHKNADELIKLLREVKALASLQHSNIVGYNAAWMEQDSPFSSSNSSSSGHSPRSKDTSYRVSQNSGPSRQDKSMSIEFMLDAEEEEKDKGKDKSRIQNSMLPGGGGMAMSARAFSSFMFTEINDIKQEHIGMKATSTIDHVTTTQSEQVTKVDIKSDIDFQYQSENMNTNQVSSSISIFQDVSENHTSENSEMPFVGDFQSTTKEQHHVLPFSNDIVSPRQPLQPRLQLESSQSNRRAQSLVTGDQENTGPILDTSDMYQQHLELSDAVDSELEIHAAKRQHISSGFRPGHSPFQRHNSQPEPRQLVKFNEDSKDSSHRRNGQIAVHHLYQRSSSANAASEVEEIIEIPSYDFGFYNSITLYIQMELCGHTLQEWLVERNSEYSSKGYELSRMCAINMRIFHQLLQGVQFIHSCGVIHRDLKPRNIFLSSNDLHVKIGDFGLAKAEVYSQESEGLAASSACDVSYIADSHTSGVGTSAYASPEQLRGSSYDTKSDMYSLGVILFEIFNVFCTEMERVKCIEDLRKKNECGSHIKEQWPVQAKAIESLTCPDPSRRPTTQDLLNNELFLSQEEKIKRLEEKVSKYEAEIARLKRESLSKDRLIAHLQARFVDEFFPHCSSLS